MILRPVTRLSQPQGPVEVDWENSLTRGLFAASPGRGEGYGFARVSGRPQSVKTSGFVLSAPGAAGYNAALDRSVTSAEWTLFSKASNSLANNVTSAFGIYGSATARVTQLYRVFTSVNWGSDARPYKTDDFTNFELAIGREYSLVTVISGSRNVIEYYVDGNLVRSAALASTAAITVSSLEIFAKNLTTDYAAPGSTVGAFAAFSRALTAQEARAISENPWQLFRPIQRRIWVPVAGGGGISQTVAFTLEDVSASVSQNLSHAQSLTGALDDVTVSISQTVQHSQALSATLDDVSVAISQTLGNATNQTLAITLDGVAVTAAQTLSHSQALDAALDGVTVAASQTLSHSQALAATLEGITVEISQSAAPSSKDQSLAVVLDGIQVSIAQEGPANLIDTHDGFWAKEWKRIRAREKRKYQAEVQERVEEIQDEIAQVEQQIVEVKQAPKPKKATPARDFYAEQARIVEHLIARRNQLIDEEDEELLLLL